MRRRIRSSRASCDRKSVDVEHSVTAFALTRHFVSVHHGVVRRYIQPQLRFLALSQLLSSTGSAMLLVGITFTAYADSGSILRTVLVTSVYLLPTVALAYWAGQVVNRHQVVNVLTAGNLAKVGLYTLLAVATVAGWVNANTLLIFSFVNGCATPFIFPAWQVYEHGLVPEDKLADLNARWQSIISIGSVAGAALGGLLLAAVGPGLVFALNTLSFLPLIAAIRRTPSPYMKPREHVPVSARAAFDHVMAMPTLRAALVRIAFLALLFAPIVQLLPAIAEKLHPGSESYGVLMGVVSAGATVVAFRLAHLRKHLDQEGLQRRTLVLSGICVLALGLSGAPHDPLPLAVPVVALLFAIGLLISMARSVIMAVIQTNVAAEFEAIVLAVVGATVAVFTALGGILMGLAAQYENVFAVLVVVGAVLLVYGLSVVVRHHIETGKTLDMAGD